MIQVARQLRLEKEREKELLNQRGEQEHNTDDNNQTCIWSHDDNMMIT